MISLLEISKLFTPNGNGDGDGDDNNNADNDNSDNKNDNNNNDTNNNNNLNFILIYLFHKVKIITQRLTKEFIVILERKFGICFIIRTPATATETARKGQ